MAKNILIISSSPRKHGNTELMCQSFAKGALENGHKVVEVFLNEKNINFCQGCAFCEKNPGKCSQQDDMSNIISELIKCDVVVFASPVYFYSLSGQMKTFIDRCVTKYLEIKNKDFYFIAGCVAQAFYHAVCDQYKQNIDVCVSGLELFKKFVRSL